MTDNSKAYNPNYISIANSGNMKKPETPPVPQPKPEPAAPQIIVLPKTMFGNIMKPNVGQPTIPQPVVPKPKMELGWESHDIIQPPVNPWKKYQ